MQNFAMGSKVMKMRDCYGEFNATVHLSKALNLYYGGWECCKPQHSFGPAVKQHYLIHYVTAGKGRLWMNNQCYDIKQGSIFLIPPQVVTTYQADKERPWQYCWICIDGYDVENILRSCGFAKNNILLIDKSNGSVCEALLNLVFFYEQNKHNEYILLSQLYKFFGCMKTQNKQLHIKSIYVDKAIDYIYKNYSQDISIQNIADYVGINRTYLFRLFKEECDMSPQKYLLNFRLKTAANKLESSDESIAEIAELCGFNDASTFCHQFKKFYNDTPLSYRKRPQIAIKK